MHLIHTNQRSAYLAETVKLLQHAHCGLASGLPVTSCTGRQR